MVRLAINLHQAIDESAQPENPFENCCQHEWPDNGEVYDLFEDGQEGPMASEGEHTSCAGQPSLPDESLWDGTIFIDCQRMAMCQLLRVLG